MNHEDDTPRHNFDPLYRQLWRVITVAVVIMVFLVLFTGCATQGLFENRIHCTLDGQKAAIVSRWAGFGIASDLTGADARAVCKSEGVKL